MSVLKITSPTNQTIKDLVRLKDRKSERAERSFLVEGFREIDRAVRSNFELENFFFCPELLNNETQMMVASIAARQVAELSKEAFVKVATRENSDGVLGVFAQKKFGFEDIVFKSRRQNIFSVAIENVEKPGNLGALLRSADAVGVHGVIVLGDPVDLWNPNVIRSSLGAVFSIPVVQASYDDYFKWCKDFGVKAFAAALSEKSKDLFASDLSGSISLLLGSEAHGLSNSVMSRADQIVKLPMNGICDSLNISVAAGVLMYEALRQRSKCRS